VVRHIRWTWIVFRIMYVVGPLPVQQSGTCSSAPKAEYPPSSLMPMASRAACIAGCRRSGRRRRPRTRARPRLGYLPLTCATERVDSERPCGQWYLRSARSGRDRDAELTARGTIDRHLGGPADAQVARSGRHRFAGQRTWIDWPAVPSSKPAKDTASPARTSPPGATVNGVGTRPPDCRGLEPKSSTTDCRVRIAVSEG
jgi:hypothetical protein